MGVKREMWGRGRSNKTFEGEAVKKAKGERMKARKW